ncbi:MAG: hypothetical protein JXB14_04640 [Candidatus Altiarchaeota archaeon]|nr:hypothetical protein [Candidatus Altiarchaeota archaeon]
MKTDNAWKIGFLSLLVIAGTGLVMANFGPGLQNLTTEQQELLTQMREARAAGDMETAQGLRAQLSEGLGGIGGFGRGMRHNNFQARGPMLEPEQHEALQNAIEDNDWTAFSSLVEEYGAQGMYPKITEDTFPLLVQIEGKRDELRDLETQLAEELGIDGGFGKGRMLGEGCPFPGDEEGA